MHLNELVTTTSTPNRTRVSDLRGKQVIPFCSRGMDQASTHISRSHNFVPADADGSYAFGQPLFPSATFYNQLVSPPSSSTVIHSVIAKDMPHSLILPVSNLQTVKRVLQIQESRMCISSASVSDFSYNIVPCQKYAKKPNPFLHLANHNSQKALVTSPTACFPYQQFNKDVEYCDVPTGRELVPYGEGQSKGKLTSTQNRIHDQDQTLPTPESTQHGSSGCQTALVTVAVPGFNSRKRPATPGAVKQRQRQARINEKLKSLHELLPHNDQGKKVAMENIVDYVKYLQLHAKALSRSKLGGDATNNPFIHLEGFGHYLLNQKSLNEPLEEIIGKMMKDNMPGVTQLLETKGLYLMPTSLAEGISGSL